MNNAFIGIGSNLSAPFAQVIKAVTEINNRDQCQVIKSSALYSSKPMGPQDQPDYVNAVIEIQTPLSALGLLDQLQEIEHDTGRVRKADRWGARILDLDIILFNNDVIENERLTVPHYGMKLREFVLIPLAEIAPELTLPDGDSVALLSQNISRNKLEKQAAISW